MACLGRGSQLRTALPINLALALACRTFVQFHLVLFSGGSGNSEEVEGLRRWVKEEFSEVMELGLLVVADCKKDFWNASVCKNTAHQLGMLRAGQEGEADDDGATVSAPRQPAVRRCPLQRRPQARRCPLRRWLPQGRRSITPW